MSVPSIFIAILLFVFGSHAVTHQVQQVGNTWSPNCIDANVGDTVTATFSSPHTFTQTSSNTSTSSSGGFNINSGSSPYNLAVWPNITNYLHHHQLSTQGYIYYICLPHASIGMRGWINVRASGDTTPSCNVVASPSTTPSPSHSPSSSPSASTTPSSSSSPSPSSSPSTSPIASSSTSPSSSASSSPTTAPSYGSDPTYSNGMIAVPSLFLLGLCAWL